MGTAAKLIFATAPIFCSPHKEIVSFAYSEHLFISMNFQVYSGTTIKKAFRQCITHHRKAYFISHLPREKKAAVINRKD
jgi:hypothetical protein